MRHSFCSAVGMCLLSSACAQTSIAAGGPLRLGGPSPVQPGDPTAYPHKTTPKAKVYVLVVAKGLPTMCTFEDCGEEGKLVEALGGWITGDTQNETIALAGLDEIEVKGGRQSLIVVSDKSARIIGIFPNQKMNDLPRILRNLGLSTR